MRLLNTNTLRPEEYVGDAPVPYAILSHTWDGQEVSLRDLEHDSNVSEKKGYSKISNACAQAREDGYDYIWVDSCCIDKSSSAELSEAINSMLDWYAGAEICYAYLSDVYKPFEAKNEGDDWDLNCGSMENAKSQYHSWEDTTFSKWPVLTVQHFKNSRWFTRGWTLQELIAPKEVTFFDANWNVLGYRNTSLRGIIASVTKIHEVVFGNYKSTAHKFTVAQKMSWASQRQTTRREDEAYCLLGILGVNMPLIYGEGRRAFRRLQQAVIETSTDHSILCHQQLGRGELLATSVKDFAGSGHITFPVGRRRNFEFAISNRGLRMTAPVLKMIDAFSQDNIWYGVALNCTSGDSPVFLLLESADDDEPATHFQLLTDKLEVLASRKLDGGGIVAAPKRSILIALQVTKPTLASGSVKLRVQHSEGLQPNLRYVYPPGAAQVYNSTWENGPITAVWHYETDSHCDFLAAILITVGESGPPTLLRWRKYTKCWHKDFEISFLPRTRSSFVYDRENLGPLSWLESCQKCSNNRSVIAAPDLDSVQEPNIREVDSGHYLLRASWYNNSLEVQFHPSERPKNSRHREKREAVRSLRHTNSITLGEGKTGSIGKLASAFNRKERKHFKWLKPDDPKKSD